MLHWIVSSEMGSECTVIVNWNMCTECFTGCWVSEMYAGCSVGKTRLECDNRHPPSKTSMEA